MGAEQTLPELEKRGETLMQTTDDQNLMQILNPIQISDIVLHSLYHSRPLKSELNKATGDVWVFYQMQRESTAGHV